MDIPKKPPVLSQEDCEDIVEEAIDGNYQEGLPPELLAEAMYMYNQELQQNWRDEALEHLLTQSNNAGNTEPELTPKEEIAQTMGWTCSGVDSYISKYKGKHGCFPPWVSKVDGAKAVYLLPQFYKWLETHAGEAAKKKRGRPPKR